MKNNPSKKHTFAVFFLLSLLAHLFVMYMLVLSGPLTLSLPVQPLSAILVTDTGADAPPSIKARPETTSRVTPNIRKREIQTEESPKGVESAKNLTQAQEPPFADDPAKPSSLSPGEQITSAISGENQETAEPVEGNRKKISSSHTPPADDYERFQGPVRNAGEFLGTKKEKLTYRISLLKIPVGTTVMEATNNNGELRITIRITSNAVFSAIYPVDDLVETRMIKGNYLLTRVRQSEGNHRGDFGFTLLLREHKAFWIDRLTNRYNYEPLPVENVMDAVSGFYYLRNRDLEVGNSVELHLFDSNEYSPTTVEVLRKERIELPGGDEVNTLVLHPLFKTAGFFRRTGDIMIWLTDDKFRLPVRLETYISLGKVTAELIAAESEPGENVVEKNLSGISSGD